MVSFLGDWLFSIFFLFIIICSIDFWFDLPDTRGGAFSPGLNDLFDPGEAFKSGTLILTLTSGLACFLEAGVLMGVLD